MRPRKISKLKFQFGHLAPGLEAPALASALEAAGLIEIFDRSSADPLQSRYVETKAMRSIEPADFERHIRAALATRAVRP